ncbi:MAG TPA: hypothetical protein VFC19_44605 [Candidatus Limnocylindrales bacterium]|nr:hypothetical protein [Candidatus Limnocylindrales bacterium]
MSADELRARFSQLAEAVVPMEDPHGRLMARRRKFVRARIASFVTLTAAVVAGGVAAPTTLLGVASGPGFEPDTAVTTPALTREEYVDRLIKAPIRGNLSGDHDMIATVQKAFTEFEPNIKGAKDPRLVFLNRTDQMLQAVVIYEGGGQPIAVASGSNLKGSVKDLVSDPVGYYAPVTPFLVLRASDPSGKATSVVGLAPPGCAIERSAKGRFTSDGSWTRTYEPEPTGDYVVRGGRTINELWRVSCDGRVREVRIADDYLDSAGTEGDAAVMYERVVRFGGVTPGRGMVQWRGNLPGFKSEAMLVSPYPQPGPAMLAIGPFPKAILATDIRERGTMPTATGRGEEWSMVALGVAGEGLTVVRVPEPFGDRTVLSDEVLVYSDFGAAAVEAVDPKQRVVASAPLHEGVAILSFDPGLVYSVRAVTAKGTPTFSVRFAELANGSRVLGDQLFKDW